MKFRYYITNTFNGCIEGTDDAALVEELALCEEFFIVDTNTGEWLSTTGERMNIKEISDTLRTTNI